MTKKHNKPSKPPAKKGDKSPILTPDKDIVAPKVVRVRFPMGRQSGW